MRLQDLLGTPPFVLAGAFIARLVPRPVGYWIARRFARGSARHRRSLYLILRTNLAHVLTQASPEELDRVAFDALYHTGIAYFEMLRTSLEDVRRGRVTFAVDAESWRIAWQALTDARPTVVVGPHLGNFDLGATFMASQGVDMYGLGLSMPNRGTRLVNWMRRRRGFAVEPISVATLREAVLRLRRGGVVVTGVDRPVDGEERLSFFGHPARLPVGHIRLALQTDARVLVVSCLWEGEGRYRLLTSLLEMEHVGSRATDLKHNAQRVVTVLEQMIRQTPDQWQMLVPVWDDAQEGGSAAPTDTQAQNVPDPHGEGTLQDQKAGQEGSCE